MSKKLIKTLRKGLFDNYLSRLESAEAIISNEAKSGMLDPEVISEAVGLVNKVSKYFEDLNKILYSAETDIVGFYKVYRSQITLGKALAETRDKIVEQEPDSPLIKSYNKQIELITPMVDLVEQVRGFLCLPRSKKRLKKWRAKNWGLSNQEFRPFMELDSRLKAVESFILEEISE